MCGIVIESKAQAAAAQAAPRRRGLRERKKRNRPREASRRRRRSVRWGSTCAASAGGPRARRSPRSRSRRLSASGRGPGPRRRPAVSRRSLRGGRRRWRPPRTCRRGSLPPWALAGTAGAATSTCEAACCSWHRLSRSRRFRRPRRLLVQDSRARRSWLGSRVAPARRRRWTSGARTRATPAAPALRRWESGNPRIIRIRKLPGISGASRYWNFARSPAPPVAEFRGFLWFWVLYLTGWRGSRPGCLGEQLGERPRPREVGEFSLVSRKSCWIMPSAVFLTSFRSWILENSGERWRHRAGRTASSAIWSRIWRGTRLAGPCRRQRRPRCRSCHQHKRSRSSSQPPRRPRPSASLPSKTPLAKLPAARNFFYHVLSHSMQELLSVLSYRAQNFFSVLIFVANRCRRAEFC